MVETLASNGAVIVEEAPHEVQAATIQIDRIETETLVVPIVGQSPLIMHRFSEKAKKKMLDAMQGKTPLKEPKNPEQEYTEAFYRLPDGTPGFPVIAFKDATIGGARFYGKQVTMTGLRQSLFFAGETGTDGIALARIAGEPQMREDVVTVGRGGTDLRYRPEFLVWTTELRVIYIPAMLTRNSVLSLIDAGGMWVGVGEWRIEKKGTSGMYRIDPDREVEVIRDHP